jgi:putative ABC transport system permease protein
MSALFRRVAFGLRALASKRRAEQELDAELHDYLESAAERKMAAGMSRVDAMRAARAEIGSIEAVKDKVRDTGWEMSLESAWRDARYAMRMLRRRPGFASVAILTLALGIGANTAVFSVAYAVLLQPLPYAGAERLVAVIPSQKLSPLTAEAVSYPTFRDWKSQTRSIEDMAGYVVAGSTLTGEGDAEALVTAAVTPNIFDLLASAPLLGRTLVPDDAASKSGRVAVISEQFWRERFDGSADVIGRTIVLDGAGHTVVGVMPKAFRFPHTLPVPQIWLPLDQFAPFQQLLEVRMAPFLTVVGRLTPSYSTADAQAEMQTILARLREHHPAVMREQIVRVSGLHEHVLGETRPSLVLLMATVGVLLLMACSNVASLHLARTVGRSREMLVRSAIGAEKSRLVRQLLIESLVLALLGGAVGVLVGVSALRLLSAPIAEELPQIRDVSINGGVLVFTFALSCATGVMFGLLPLLGSAGVGSSGLLGAGGRGTTTDRRHSRSQDVLVMVQVALALVTLTTAGLLLRSLSNLQGTAPGFNHGHLLTATISLPQSDYPTPERWLEFNASLLDRARQLPGVESAAVGVSVPFLGAPVAVPFEIEGAATNPPAMTDVAFTSDGYFRTMQIPVLRGREFATADRRQSLRVAVVNRAFAQRFVGGDDVIGRRIHVGPPKGVWVEVVGLVGDTVQSSLVMPPPALLYMPYAQRPFWLTTVVVRTTREPQTVAASLRREVRSIATSVPILALEPMSMLLRRSYASSSHRTMLLVLFGALAALLAAIGIHGLVAYTVANRINEIGIRLALGAQPAHVRRAVVVQGVRLALAGMSIGLVICFALTHFLATLLYRVSSTDPITFSGVVVLLFLVTLVACYLPARRATHVDPLTALRCE